jgi:hypothetical protein
MMGGMKKDAIGSEHKAIDQEQPSTAPQPNSRYQVVSYPGVTLYVWKWAKNDAPGRIQEIVSTVAKEQQPSALAEFDADAVADQMIAKVRSLRLPQGLVLGVSNTVRSNGKQIALAVGLAGTITKEVINQVTKVATAMGLTVFNRDSGHLVGDSAPKHHLVSSENHADILDPTWTMIARTLRRLDARKGDHYMVLANHRGDFVVVFACDSQYAVDWVERCSSVRTGYIRRCAGHKPMEAVLVDHGTAECYTTVFASELLTEAEALGIFRVFYQGGGRPDGYHWRDIPMKKEGVG